SAAKPLVHKIHIQPVLNIYAAYCFLIEQGNYTAFKVLNDSQAFNSHFQLLVGFIYDCDDITTKNRYSLCSNIKKIFNYIAHDKQLTLDEVQLSSIKMTEDTSSCL
nr:hypothetical protein [Vibrio anguillarum]